MKNPRIGTPWQVLHGSRSDRAYITTMGVDCETFDKILEGGFHVCGTQPPSLVTTSTRSQSPAFTVGLSMRLEHLVSYSIISTRQCAKQACSKFLQSFLQRCHATSVSHSASFSVYFVICEQRKSIGRRMRRNLGACPTSLWLAMLASKAHSGLLMDSTYPFIRRATR